MTVKDNSNSAQLAAANRVRFERMRECVIAIRKELNKDEIRRSELTRAMAKRFGYRNVGSLLSTFDYLAKRRMLVERPGKGAFRFLPEVVDVAGASKEPAAEANVPVVKKEESVTEKTFSASDAFRELCRRLHGAPVVIAEITDVLAQELGWSNRDSLRKSIRAYAWQARFFQNTDPQRRTYPWAESFKAIALDGYVPVADSTRVTPGEPVAPPFSGSMFPRSMTEDTPMPETTPLSPKDRLALIDAQLSKLKEEREAELRDLRENVHVALGELAEALGESSEGKAVLEIKGSFRRIYN